MEEKKETNYKIIRYTARNSHIT